MRDDDEGLNEAVEQQWVEEEDLEQPPPPPPPPMKEARRDKTQYAEAKRPLTLQEIWNLSFCLLAWAFAVCNVTLVVGTINIVVLSIGGSPQISSVPLGTFFVGAFVISCGITGNLFKTQGRKFTFLVGIAISMFGTVLGGVSLMSKSPGLLSIATLCFGAANGIAFFLRFAAVELVPEDWVATAVALVVSGGVIAAFAGPETSIATRGLFGPEDHLEFMGVFMMTGIFNVCKALCIAAVEFPHVSDNDLGEGDRDSFTTQKTARERVVGFFTMYHELLRTKSFVIPLAVAALSWAIMAVPMSLLRVAMTQAGHSARDSLLVIELHFVGMYGTGFITASLISWFGHKAVTTWGLLISILSIILSLVTRADSSKVIWLMGMLFLGMGWNLGFTGSTVWLTKCVDTQYSKGQIQAANDSLMFLIAGIFTFSASYIFEAGGSNVRGWRVLNASVIALLMLFGAILTYDLLVGNRQRSTTDKETPERLDSFEESVIDEISQKLQQERQIHAPDSPSGASTIIRDLAIIDHGARVFPGSELNYGDGTDEEDDTWPPPAPPTLLRIIDIEEGASYRSERLTTK